MEETNKSRDEKERMARGEMMMECLIHFGVLPKECNELIKQRRILNEKLGWQYALKNEGGLKN